MAINENICKSDAMKSMPSTSTWVKKTDAIYIDMSKENSTERKSSQAMKIGFIEYTNFNWSKFGKNLNKLAIYQVTSEVVEAGTCGSRNELPTGIKEFYAKIFTKISYYWCNSWFSFLLHA